MSEFSDRPLYAGTITGLRAFKVDRLGRLVGPQRETVFTPGENTATCLKSTWDLMQQSMTASLRRGLFPSVSVSVPVHSAHENCAYCEAVDAEGSPEPHRVAGLPCTCGFYAYFDGSNDYHKPTEGTVQAIVEGYGTVTMGDRGFRAEKARLVALVLHPQPKGWQVAPGRYLSWWTLAVILWLAALMVVDIVSGAWTAAAVAGAFAALNGVVAWTQIRRRHDMCRCELVRRNYPDVPVYSSLAKVLRDHPITTPAEVTPDTCDDFWIRRAGA